MTVYTVTLEKMEAALNEWDKEIELMEARFDDVEYRSKNEGAPMLSELRAKQHVATEMLREMKATTNESWGNVKATAKIWGEIKAGVDEARFCIG